MHDLALRTAITDRDDSSLSRPTPTAWTALNDTSPSSGTSAPWPMQGLLVCASCGRPLHPQLALRARTYQSVCGCRLRPVDAQAVEDLVAAAVQQRFPALTAGVPDHCRAAVVRQLLLAITVGSIADDLTIQWRD